MVYVALAVAPDIVSVAVTVKVRAVTAAFDVPEIAPAADIVNPVGRPAAAYVYAPLPPVGGVTFALYAMPTEPLGSV